MVPSVFLSRCSSVPTLAWWIYPFVFSEASAATGSYTPSLHDALPIFRGGGGGDPGHDHPPRRPGEDRKSTRLNSSHLVTSYAVFCLKKKKERRKATPTSRLRTRTLPRLNSLLRTTVPHMR